MTPILLAQIGVGQSKLIASFACAFTVVPDCQQVAESFAYLLCMHEKVTPAGGLVYWTLVP
jgi:hypothetical protein